MVALAILVTLLVKNWPDSSVSMEELPTMAETASIEDPAPVEDPVPAEDPSPAEDPVPVEDPVTVEDPVAAKDPVPAQPSHALVQQLQQLCSADSGIWDVRFEPLDSGETIAHSTGDGNGMVSASVIKLFVMAAVYDQIKQGLLSHEDVYQPIVYMITVSDNYSTNQLIRLLGGGDAAAGMDVVNDYAASIGCTSTVLRRLMLENNGLQNSTSASDCAKLLRMIYESRCVSVPWSQEMLQILRQQTVCNRIPAGLPEGTACANKTGDLAGLCVADVGIVFTSQGDYILCAICNEPRSDTKAAQIIAQLSAAVYHEVVQNEQ